MYLNYCKGLKFAEDPDYMYLRQLFRVLFRMNNHQYDFIYDWSTFKKDNTQNGGVSISKAKGGTNHHHDHHGARKLAKSPGRTSNRRTPAARLAAESPALVSASPGVSLKQSPFSIKEKINC